MKSHSLFAVLLATVLWNGTLSAKTDLLVPPVNTVTNAPRLSNLLQGPSGKAIVTKRDWQKEREQIKKGMVRLHGELPKDRAPLKTEFLQKEDLGTFDRQYVRYQIEEGVSYGWISSETERNNGQAASGGGVSPHLLEPGAGRCRIGADLCGREAAGIAVGAKGLRRLVSAQFHF